MFRIGFKAGLFSTVMFLGAVPVPATTAPTNSSSSVAPLILSGRQSARPAGTFSPGVAEIIKMLDAKVEAEVLLAYIQNSPTAYNPDAAELIALKSHGASTELMTAILHHGDELRLRLAQAATTVNPAPAAPAYDYAAETSYPAYSATPYPDSGGVAYPTVYYGYGYGYRSPGLCHSSTWNGCRPWYDYGRWWAKFDYGHHGENWNNQALSTAPLGPTLGGFWGSAAGGGHTTALAAHSTGGQVSGARSAARPSARSR